MHLTRRYRALIQGITTNQLLSTESATANKSTTKYSKRCQIL